MPNEETKYVIKKGDKYLKDGRYYHSDPVEVGNIAEARFFKTLQGARSSRYCIRVLSEEYQEWANDNRNWSEKGRPPYYHPTKLKDGYPIVPVTIKATVQVEEK